MAALYANAAHLFTDGSFSWADSTVRALFLSSAYVFDPAQVFVDDLDPSHIVATSGDLLTPTFDNNIAGGGGPFTFDPFLDTRIVNGIAMYLEADDPAYSRLIAYYGADDLIGVPFTPAGEFYYIYPDAALGGFFRIEDNNLVGPVNTYSLAFPLALAEATGGLSVDFFDLFVGGRLAVRERVCMPADEGDTCCAPTIRSSSCA